MMMEIDRRGMQEGRLRFGECELHVAGRELVLRGQVQQLEPKPFEVLVYLLRNRDRVVSKDELLDNIWPGEFVSPSVVARAVMKARQAIGDSDEGPGAIRTVHRTGYRFIGSVEESAAQAAESPAPEPSPRQPPAPAATGRVASLALMPFDNRTGQADLDWVELGLLSLVVNALGANPKLSIVPIASLLAALDAQPTQPASTRLQATQRLLGVHHMLEATLTSEDGQYCLTWNLSGLPQSGAQRLLCSEPSQLGQKLAREIEAALLPGSEAVAFPFESTDPLARQALARALQDMAQQKWSSALNLLKVVLDIVPDHQAVLLEKLRALTALDEEQAFEVGSALLARAEAGGDTNVASAVHLALAELCSRRRQIDRARDHIDESLRLSSGREAQDWVTSALLLRASIAIHQLDFDTAQEHLDRAQLLCDASGNQLHQAKLLSLRTVVQAETGHIMQAWQLARQTVELYREHGLHAGWARASSNLANLCAHLGYFREAVEHAEGSIAVARRLNYPTDVMMAAVMLSGLYRQLRRPDDAERVVSMAEELGVIGTLSPAYSHVCRAQLCAARQRHDEAAERLLEARALLQKAGQLSDHHFVLPLLGTALVLSGRYDGARQLFEEMQALPNYSGNQHLQGALMHCRAQLALAEGDRALACDLLDQASDITPIGWWHANACIDGAWLHLEAGDVERARTMLTDAGAWLAEHPAGLAVQARLHHAEGRHAQAQEAHQHYVASLACEVPNFYAGLGEVYAEAGQAAPQQKRAVPLTPYLPTSM